MTSHCRNRLYALQILGVATGIIVPLVACFTLFYAATTGQMPIFATGALPLLLLAATGLLGCWVWTQGAELA
ncbi:hypothetical protein [Gloeobacter kilaueensis]|uniref:Uncharacterized protein n=1 Tax=Gloeobacter kilaueensis (strain ATCC BAA-2537 / CCAP 1431/1 / ULC 316 / JS1) TaxID=1183438 RepID=U5QKE2_GLOK1|nr:hypothetical protein [Gloeobacter kilaueensis]AGY59323.1 hypothetical protein GKIL_3077 [Gloeobacter kilaueensis JS1]